MRNVFKSNHRVTQKFNERPDYYKQFGLKGHEGIDLVPTGSDWTVLCLADGVVVKDVENPKSGAYGNNVTVWHPTLRKATQYCHLKENNVSLGESVSEGQLIGIMGKTGNTSGTHLHLNLFETDENGVRLNRDNGYFGGIDPLPFLEGNEQIYSEKFITVTQKEFDSLRLRRDELYNFFTTICDTLQLSHDVGIDTVVRSINAYKGNAAKAEELERQLNTVKTAYEEQVSTLKQMLLDKESVVANLQLQQGEFVMPYIEQLKMKDEQLVVKDTQIIAMAEDIKKLKLAIPTVTTTQLIVELFKRLTGRRQ